MTYAEKKSASVITQGFLSKIEKFVCSMYINNDVNTTNEARLATGLMPFGIDDIIVDDTQ